MSESRILNRVKNLCATSCEYNCYASTRYILNAFADNEDKISGVIFSKSAIRNATNEIVDPHIWSEFEKHNPKKPLLFHFQINSYMHAFLIEKIANDKKNQWRVYQSWQASYSVLQWLGHGWPHTHNPRNEFENNNPRNEFEKFNNDNFQNYGEGKVLDDEKLKKFILSTLKYCANHSTFNFLDEKKAGFIHTYQVSPVKCIIFDWDTLLIADEPHIDLINRSINLASLKLVIDTLSLAKKAGIKTVITSKAKHFNAILDCLLRYHFVPDEIIANKKMDILSDHEKNRNLSANQTLLMTKDQDNHANDNNLAINTGFRAIDANDNDIMFTKEYHLKRVRSLIEKARCDTTETEIAEMKQARTERYKPKIEDMDLNEPTSYYKDLFRYILVLIKDHEYQLHHVGKFGANPYSASASRIKDLIEAKLSDKTISHQKYNYIAFEIESILIKKCKTTTGFFGIGKRDQSTVNLYVKIQAALSLETTLIRQKNLTPNPLKSHSA